MSDDAQEWRWVGEDGVEKTVTESELIAELSAESLPSYTLIWKKGWLEWLPAMQVDQLAWALPPGKADEPIAPREKATAVKPPAPPLYRYPVLKRRAGNLRTDKPPARSPVVAPRPGPKRADAEPSTLVLDTSRSEKSPDDADARSEPTVPRSLTAPEPPTQEWRPLDSRPVEEVEFDSIEASNPHAAGAALQVPAGLDPFAPESNPLPADAESRPGPTARQLLENAMTEASDPVGFGAFAPFEAPRPAAAELGAAYGDDDEVETRVIPSRPPPPAGPLYVGPHAPRASEHPPPSAPFPSHMPADLQADLDDEELPRIPPPPPPPADLSAYAGLARGPEGTRQKNIGLVAASAALAALVIIALVLVTRRTEPPASGTPAEPATEQAARDDKPQTRPQPSAPPKPQPKYDQRCTVTTPATRVSDWAEPSVTPTFAVLPGSQRVVVGFGQSDVYAIGITVDPKTLDRDQVFREFRKQKLVSVVPTVDDGSVHFRVTRNGSALSNSRAVGSKTPFYIGATKTAIARVVERREDKQLPLPLWPLTDADQSTVPRVATVPGIGHLVALRRGGRTGKVALGWLDPSGGRKTELVDFHAGGQFAGIPSVAAGEDGVLVAFASRDTDAVPWRIELAAAKHSELPKTATEFALPPGGPGGDAMSPSVAALSGGRWLVQWTEGSSGYRRVRAQVLSRELTPLTEPVNLSPAGANAGQGVVWSKDELGVILFYVQNDHRTHELWGSSIACAR